MMYDEYSLEIRSTKFESMSCLTYATFKIRMTCATIMPAMLLPPPYISGHSIIDFINVSCKNWAITFYVPSANKSFIKLFESCTIKSCNRVRRLITPLGDRSPLLLNALSRKNKLSIIFNERNCMYKSLGFVNSFAIDLPHNFDNKRTGPSWNPKTGQPKLDPSIFLISSCLVIYLVGCFDLLEGFSTLCSTTNKSLI